MAEERYGRWNVDPTWHHCSSMHQEAFHAIHASNEFAKYHHLRGFVYFSIATLESFLNQQMRFNLEREDQSEDKIFSKIRNTGLKDKLKKWPRKICPKEVRDFNGVAEDLLIYVNLRDDLTHPKHYDHGIYLTLDRLNIDELIRMVTDYIILVYEGLNESFLYWLLGWNYVGFNGDEANPCLINNQQFLHSLLNMGFEVPAFKYGEALAWEKENMLTLDGYRKIKLSLDKCDLEIEPFWPDFPLKPRLTKKWWDENFIKNSK